MRRFISVILVFCIVFCQLPVMAEEGNTYQGEGQFYNRLAGVNFNDISYLPVDHWSNTAIYSMALLGLLKGTDGDFLPTDTATRSEVLAVLFRSAGMEEDAGRMKALVEQQRLQNPRQYNSIDSWADGYLRLAIEEDIITVEEFLSAMDRFYEKDENPLFGKDKPVTRSELTRWIVVLFDIPMAERENEILDFEDNGDIPERDRLYMETAVRNGIMNGVDGKLLPKASITREQLAQIFYNIFDVIIEKQGIAKKTARIDDISVVTENGDGKIKNITTIKAGDDSFLVTRQYDMIGEAVDSENINPENQYEDFMVLAHNHMPSDTSLLSKADMIDYYFNSDNKILFIFKQAEKPMIEYKDEDYDEAAVYEGKLYLYDKAEQLLILEKDGDYIEIPYMDNLEIYNRNEKISADELNLKWLDCKVYVFTVVKKTGGLNRAYRMQIIK